MNGLLEDPAQAGLLSMGLRLLSTPGKFGQAFGQAGLGAMGDIQQAQAAQQVKKARALQEQLLSQQLEQIKAQQAERAAAAQRQQGVEGAYRGAFESPAQQALAGGGGPTVANAQAMQGMQPRVNQQRLIEGLMQADPMLAAQLMQPKPRKLMTVAPGASVLDETDPTKAVFTAPERPKEDDMSALVIRGPDGQPMVNPIALEARRKVAEAGASRVNVSPILRQESAESQSVGKYFGDLYGNLMDSRRTATGMNSRLDQMARMMDGVNTGKLTPAMAEVAALAKSFGINIDPGLEAKQAIEAMSNEMALEMRNPAGGAGMPGALSDKDREFLVKIVPNLGKTPGGNRMIIDARKRLNQREIDVANKAAEYRRRNGSLDDGFFAELEAWSAANPLFGDMAPGAAAGGTDGRVRRFNPQTGRIE
jgi:hypothetical protein